MDSNDLDSGELERQTALTWRIALGVALLLPVSYWLWFSVLSGVPAATDPAPWGAFGDFVGGILNPFVAFFALYWLTRSIKIQKQELAATKKELAESRQAQENQARTLEKQRFEDTFFALLSQHNALLQKLIDQKESGISSVSPAEYLNNVIHSKRCGLGQASFILKNADKKFGNYFRVLYQLLKHVALRGPGSIISNEFTADEITTAKVHPDEKLYTNMVRAFIDVDMAQLLAINCFCTPVSSFWRYKCLLERYEFLEHMPFERNSQKYIPMVEAYHYYDRSVFGMSDYLSQVVELNLSE